MLHSSPATEGPSVLPTVQCASQASMKRFKTPRRMLLHHRDRPYEGQ